ncbi:hypothetical protein SUGI_0300790 [Cryptomeria japonica]|nr:hypothetical protein SUGI_0300790 [Cryptomeria japonica]
MMKTGPKIATSSRAVSHDHIAFNKPSQHISRMFTEMIAYSMENVLPKRNRVFMSIRRVKQVIVRASLLPYLVSSVGWETEKSVESVRI